MNTDTAFGGIVSFSLSREAAHAADRAAGAELISRSAFVRKVLIEHLRRAGHLATDVPVTPGAARRCRREAQAA